MLKARSKQNSIDQMFQESIIHRYSPLEVFPQVSEYHLKKMTIYQLISFFTISISTMWLQLFKFAAYDESVH